MQHWDSALIQKAGRSGSPLGRLPPSHVLPFGLKDNFWEMGETGPCGPCTEIHYDHIGGRNAADLVNCDSPDVVEIWNLVFMQYSRESDGTLRALPQHNVDTGMGLERLVTVLQGKRSNYDTDLFMPLIEAIHKGSNAQPYKGLVGKADSECIDMAYRVVADHIRTLSICIADGVYPGISGAELVLRRILRRAVRYCTEVLQAPSGFLATLVPLVVDSLGDAYPELKRDVNLIMDIINRNEAAFLSSLHKGRRVIERTLEQSTNTVFPVDVAWSLHRNLGFPLDLIGLMLEERGIAFDTEALDRLAAEDAKRKFQSEQEKTSSKLQPNVHILAELQRRGIQPTDDFPKYAYSCGQDGRYVFSPCQATVLALYTDDCLVSEVSTGQLCGIILDRTSFYAEQGGQAADHGYLMRTGQQDLLFPVTDVQSAGGYVIHEVTAPETLRVGDHLQLFVDETQRLACMVKHTATHLLNFALHTVLGETTEQRGSHVTAERLRFDFSIKAPVTKEQLKEIENVIHELIQKDEKIHMAEVPLKLTSRIPGLRTIDEVYPDPVRVVSVGATAQSLLQQDVKPEKQGSVELCCGTHLLQTGAIEDFVVVSERQLVQGVSRIVAVTGQQAKQAREVGEALAQEVESLSHRLQSRMSSLCIAQRLSKEIGQLTETVDNAVIPQCLRRELQGTLKAFQRTANTAIRKLETKEAMEKSNILLKKHHCQYLVVDAVATDSLSILMKVVNQLCNQLPNTAVMLLSQLDSGKVFCACQVPKSITGQLSAAEWSLAVCSQIDGNAGGSSIVAKGSGSTSDLAHVLNLALEFAEARLHR
ncbi:alanine--tRNA ligase, mitochondrial isoform X2 [Protopterus annectens]|uniref:alanine--tRNA ligase, mitochondrial isoform X2 n=1 Tax=Protopterus annectens TaxID=7888 RepID=UPI001CFBC7E5|nr:alanine--tRNA ligase, mitochondrial isoform X2 [Protopterus annectens]